MFYKEIQFIKYNTFCKELNYKNSDSELMARAI